MGLLNQTGYYRGVIVEGNLTQSSGGFPQEEWTLKAQEVWDPDENEYLPVDEDHDEITAYLILVSKKDKMTKTSEQVKKITGWDGASFIDLAEMDVADLPLSFRIDENDYEGNISLRVQWVDLPDAAPGRTIQKLEKKDVQALQTRYAHVLAATKTPPKPVSAASKKAGKPKAGKPKAEKPKASKTVVGRPKASKTVVGKCTVDEAYDACYGLKRNDVTDEQLNELWLAEVDKTNADESKITDEQWFEIKETILKQVGKV